MNKKEFLHILEISLSDFDDEEKKEILYDYEEHFRIGEESGKSEYELIKELGDPNKIANQYRTSNKNENNDVPRDKIEKDRPTIVSVIVGSALLLLLLLLFNLIFILGPYIGIAASIIGLFAAAIGIIIGGIGMTFGMILSPLLPQFISMPNGIPGFAIILLGN